MSIVTHAITAHPHAQKYISVSQKHVYVCKFFLDLFSTVSQSTVADIYIHRQAHIKAACTLQET
jgi:hypothetical protein